MSYKEIELIQLSGSAEATDIIIAELAENNYEGFWEIPGGFKAYIPTNDFNKTLLESILESNKDFATFSIIVTDLADKNWNEQWEKNFTPVVIAEKCMVRADFHPAPSTDLIDLIITPKMSFGTGHHQTTSSMISLMMENDFNSKSVMDMGCGTGVLAILAEKLGASNIDAVDIDVWSFENAAENIEKNKCNNIRVYQGDVTFLDTKKYDIFLANINRNIILEDIEAYINALNNNGLLFLSGFYAEDVAIISENAKRLGLSFVKQKENTNWCALVFKK
jgi:ribosomal protein L11 methyltransferase